MPNFSKSASAPYEDAIDVTNHMIHQLQSDINYDFDLRLQDIEACLEQNTATLHSMMTLVKSIGELISTVDLLADEVK